MATIINNPSGGDHHDGEGGVGVGMILGIIVAALIVIGLFYVYGWPAIRGNNQPSPAAPTNTYNVTIPNPVAPAPAPVQ